MKSPEEVVRRRRYMRILDAPAIEHGWWNRVSDGARSKTPHYETLMDLHLEDFVEEVAREQHFEDGDPSIVPLPELPDDLDHVAKTDFPISQDEGLALLHRYLLAERGELAKGAEMLVLHWLVLCGAYCPQRERYYVLHEFLNIGYLQEKVAGVEYSDSGLRWPLVILPPCIEAIEQLVYVRKYVPDLYSISRKSALFFQHIPLLRTVTNGGAKLLLPKG